MNILKFVMPSGSKRNSKKRISKKAKSHKVKDYGNEPLFVQKAEASKKVMERYGLPEKLSISRK